ncbi:hypothetical protein ACINK0_15625 [Deinococcus sp. VB343]
MRGSTAAAVWCGAAGRWPRQGCSPGSRPLL